MVLGFSTQTNYLLIFLVLYFVGFIAIGYGAYRRGGSSLDDYFLAGRDLGYFVLFWTFLATLYSGAFFFAFPSDGYSAGFTAVAAVILITASVYPIIFYIFGRRIWVLGRVRDHITTGDYVADRFDSDSLGAFVGIAQIVSTLPFLALQLASIAIVLDGITGGELPFMLNLTIFSLIVGAYVILGGMASVAWSDSIQGVLFSVAFIALVWLAITNMPNGLVGGMQSLYAERPELFSLGGTPGFWALWPVWISLVITQALQILNEPQIWTRINTARNYKVISASGFIAFGVIAFVVGLFAVFAGPLMAANISVENPDALVGIFLNSVTSPVVAGAILGLGVLAAFSSADSIALSLATVGERDVIEKLIAREMDQEFSEGQFVTISRILVAVTIISAAILAATRIIPLFDLLLLAFVLWAVLAPTTLLTLYWRGATAAGAWSSIIVGYGVAFIIYVGMDLGAAPFQFGLTVNFWAPVAALVVFVVVSLLTSRPDEEVISDVFDPIEAAGQIIEEERE